MRFKEYVDYLMAQNSHIRPAHGRPLNRRQLFAQGYLTAGSTFIVPSLLSTFARKAQGQALDCSVASKEPTGNIPFIAIDLGGGANLAGANVLVGAPGSQQNYLAAASYGTLGLGPDVAPSTVPIDPALPNIDASLGLEFHGQSAMKAGINVSATAETQARTDGVVFAARSGDDTRNNPHNPMYWLAKAGLTGEVLSLIGTEDTASGGRAMAPASSIVAALKPALVRNVSDATGLVLPGVIAQLLGDSGVARVMEATRSMSERRLAQFSAQSIDKQVQDLLKCGYAGSIAQVTEFSSADMDPEADPIIDGLFDFGNNDQERAGTMAKLVLDGYVGGATLTLGGYDYHGGDRANADQRDQRAGEIIGKFMEAAVQKQQDLMLYVFTDGGISCNTGPGRTDPRSDSGVRSAAFSLVVNGSNPAGGRPAITNLGRQIGGFNSEGAVDQNATLLSNSVENLTRAVVLQYLALHGREGEFASIVDQNPFAQDMDKYIAFGKLRG